MGSVIFELGEMLGRNRPEFVNLDDAKREFDAFVRAKARRRKAKDLSASKLSALRKLDNRRCADHRVPEDVAEILELPKNAIYWDAILTAELQPRIPEMV